MKANEFVKKFGWEEAKSKVDDCDFLNAESFNFMGVNVAASDLKRLIESHELVEEFDDLEQAKSWIPDMDIEMPYKVRGSNRRFMKDELIQAIADVESCL